MSSSAYMAKLIVPSIGSTFYFNTVRLPKGWPEEDSELIEQVLESNGVDNHRFREIRFQFAQFDLATMADFASWDAGVSARQGYIEAKREIATLHLIVRSTTYRFDNFKILDVVPVLRAGTAVGYGAETNSSAILTATWTGEFMDTPR